MAIALYLHTLWCNVWFQCLDSTLQDNLLPMTTDLLSLQDPSASSKGQPTLVNCKTVISSFKGFAVTKIASTGSALNLRLPFWTWILHLTKCFWSHKRRRKRKIVMVKISIKTSSGGKSLQHSWFFMQQNRRLWGWMTSRRSREGKTWRRSNMNLS